MRPCNVRAFIGACLLLLPVTAAAQSSIGGRVTDDTGAVMPGVTVEAASAALIEGTRVAVTDGSGQYRIVDLRPGAYTVTFTLTGFASVRRTDIVLETNFTAPINVEMKIGQVAENVTVMFSLMFPTDRTLLTVIAKSAGSTRPSRT